MKQKIALVLLVLTLLGVSVDSKIASFAFRVASEFVEDTPAQQVSPDL